MSLLILAHARDALAQAVAQRLRPGLGEQLLQVAPEALASAAWALQQDAQGRLQTRLTLADGRVICSRTVQRVWSRVQALPQPAFARSPAKDRDYAAAELQALVSSWLAEWGSQAEPAQRAHCSPTPALALLHWLLPAQQLGLMLHPVLHQALQTEAQPPSAAQPVPDLAARSEDAPWRLLLAWGQASWLNVRGTRMPPPPDAADLLQRAQALAQQLQLRVLELRWQRLGPPEAPLRLVAVLPCPNQASAAAVECVAAGLLRWWREEPASAGVALNGRAREQTS
ncbi:hypothetical protein ACG0Z6_04460 [Roseateles sp. BYS180W]|uniref:Uncharacterized protein n=1 Tax=Roseateles rivi TaxID=3299028 RepID=A0ABW7FT47_9BURK